MKSGISAIFLLFAIAVFIFISGCTGTVADSASQADELYSKGMTASEEGNYKTAEKLFEEAEILYNSAGDLNMALNSKREKFRAFRSVVEYPFNETEAKKYLKEMIPGITDEEIKIWLSESAQSIDSDGETLYYEQIYMDYLYENCELLWNMKGGLNFDYASRFALSGNLPPKDSPYFNPVLYSGTEKLIIPGDKLTKAGTMKIWFPLPLETESQTDITVENLSYEEYIIKGPVTKGQIGYVYYEIPAEKIEGDLVISADIVFKSYEQGFYVDPEKVLAYNKEDPEYILYTKSARNIEITDEIKQKALEIVGDETNPYLQSVMIYNHIIETYPYSQVPHLSLDTIEPKTAESTYMFESGHGDCGTQSMLFSALCRSLGIPARATGGYQMILAEKPGTHFWAEYYIEGYGWIPCDPTVAEIADWVDIEDEKRTAFKEYYSHNLDNSRFVIQKDVDAEMTPEIPEDAVVFRLVRQGPVVIHDEAQNDISFIAAEGFSVDLKAV